MLESKAKQFVEQFEKASKIIADNAPKWLCYSIIIYARDPEEKSEIYPDWYLCFKTLDKTNYYDRATIEQYIKEKFRKDE